MKTIIIVTGALLVLWGCSSIAGPYVTNISSDGRCNIVIEKDTVYLNGFTGIVSSGGTPSSITIRVCNPDKQ